MAELVIRQPSVALAQQFEHNLAVVIGINKYAYVRELKTARPDAESLAGVLQDKRRDPLDHYEVIECYDQQASANTLSTLLFETLPARVRQLGNRTRVLFYFAGHGDAEDSGDGLQGFLFPQDAKPGDDTTLLPMSKVQDALAGLDCQHVLIILDCCSAGALPMPQRTRSALRPPPLYWDYFQRYVKRKARQVITSAAHNQLAADEDTRKQLGTHKLGDRDADAGAGHSPFAQALLEALNPEHESSNRPREAGRNGVVTATDLYLYISEVLYRRVGDAQTPGLWTVIGQDPHKSHDQGEFVFLVPGTQIKLEDAPDLTRPGHNPWLGLSAYGPDQADLFAGRDTEIRDLAQMVEAHPLVAVTGPSAAGKTSLLRAGLLPWLADRDASQASGVGRHWHILPPLSLGKAPLEALGMQVAAHLPAVAATGAADASLPDLNALAARVAAWIEAHPDRRLLLALDVEEALFDTVATEERTKLWALLAQVAQRDILHVVLTLRSDHWRLAEASENATKKPLLPAAVRYELGPMNRDALRQVIEEPAAARMVYLASEKLVDTLVDAVEGQPATLPLLSETLRRMYLRYAEAAREGLRTDRTLTQEDYAAQGDAGGVGGVAADLAKTFYQERLDDAHRRQAMQRVLLRLVDVKQGQYERRQAAHVEFEYPDPETNIRTRAVIAGLADQGLVVLSADAAGAPVIELGHVALIEAWASLRGWLLDPSKQWGLQRELREQVEEWQPNKPTTLLWDDDPRLPQVEERLWPADKRGEGLMDRLRWERRVLFPPKDAAPAPDAWVNRAELDFVRESVSERSGFRQKLFGAVAAITVVIALIGGIALWQRGVAVHNEQIAIENQAKAERRLSVQLLALSNLASQNQQTARRVLLLLEAAKAFSPMLPAVQIALYDALMAPNGYGISSVNPGNTPGLIRFSPDNRWLAIADTRSILADPIFLQMNPMLSAPSYAVQIHDLQHLDAAPLVARSFGKPITGILFSEDGTVLFVASGPQLFLWDLSKSEPAPVTLHTFATNIDQLVSIFHDRQLVVSTASETYLMGAETIPNAIKGHFLSMSADRKQVLTTDDEKVFLWDLNEPAKAPRTFLVGTDSETTIAHAEFSPNSHWMVMWNSYGSARLEGAEVILWDADEPDSHPVELYRGRRGPLTVDGRVLFSADGEQLILTGFDLEGQIQVFDLATPETKSRTLTALSSEPIIDLDLSADGRLLAVTTLTGIYLWDMPSLSNDPATLARDADSGFFGSVLSGDSRLVASTSGRDVRVWDLESSADGSSFFDYEGCEFVCGNLQMSHDEQWLAAIDSDNVRLWMIGVPSSQPKVAYESESWPWTVALSTDSRFLATGYDDGQVRLWDTSSPNASPIAHKDHTGPVYRLQFSPDNAMLVSASADQTARLWRIEPSDGDLKPLLILDDHNGKVYDADFSHNGRWLATASEDKLVRLWQVDQFDRISTGMSLTMSLNSAVTAVAFSANDERLFIGTNEGEIYQWAFLGVSDDLEKLYDSETRNAVWDVEASVDGSWLAASVAGSMYLLDLRTGDDRFVPGWRWARSVEFSQDARWLAGGNQAYSDGKQTNSLWIADLTIDELTPISIRHPSEVIDQVFSADGNHITTADSAGTIRTWSLIPEILMRQACRVPGRNLTQEEWETYFPGETYRVTCPTFPIHWTAMDEGG